MYFRFLFVLLTASLFFSCNTSENQYQIIPYPNSLEPKAGQFRIHDRTKIVLPANAGEKINSIALDFIDELHKTSGFIITQEATNNKSIIRDAINFVLNEDLKAESYILTVKRNKVIIEASDASGFFYALQSFKQLMPVEIYGDYVAANDTEWLIPCVVIKDVPRFKYRGMHMDVARHFFGPDEVKRVIDIISFHKLNTLHWHLTDDQGWRIEIKKYPELTEKGSVRKGTMIRKEWGNYDNIPYGGFFTQEEIKEIVDYAAQKQITVIPEVDLPGHMVAALATFPYLGCTGGPYEVSGEWGVLDDVLCVGKESTFTFLENVLSEVMELFPTEYIHIGGDECPKIKWEKCSHCQAKIKELGLKADEHHSAEHYLQSYTISRIAKFLNDNGRKVIGWDEILEGGIAEDATVMSWRGMDGGIEAARLGHDVIMAPSSHCYFDYYQSLDIENEPFGIGGYIPVEKVYSLEPVPDVLSVEEQKHIIGPQANLWTEYIKTDKHFEYMLLPRLAALSEVQWTQPAFKSWDRFLDNLGHIVKIYDIMDYPYGKHVFEVMGKYTVNPVKQCVEAELSSQGNVPIYYTMDGSEPTSKSKVYDSPVEIKESCTLHAIVKRAGMETRPLIKSFNFNKATGKKLILNTQPKAKYTYGGSTVLNDGLRGGTSYSTGYWLGYEEEPMDITIEFPEPTEVSSVAIGTFIQLSEWIFPPERITVYAKKGNQDFTMIAEKEILVLQHQQDELKEYGCTFSPFNADKIRIKADNVRVIPDWHGARGHKGFIFIDEIIIN